MSFRRISKIQYKTFPCINGTELAFSGSDKEWPDFFIYFLIFVANTTAVITCELASFVILVIDYDYVHNFVDTGLSQNFDMEGWFGVWAKISLAVK